MVLSILKRQFTKEKFSFNISDLTVFVYPQWPMPHLLFVLIRFAMFMYTVFGFIHTAMDMHSTMMKYFTVWSYTVLILHLGFAANISLLHYRQDFQAHYSENTWSTVRAKASLDGKSTVSSSNKCINKDKSPKGATLKSKPDTKLDTTSNCQDNSVILTIQPNDTELSCSKVGQKNPVCELSEMNEIRAYNDGNQTSNGCTLIGINTIDHHTSLVIDTKCSNTTYIEADDGVHIQVSNNNNNAASDPNSTPTKHVNNNTEDASTSSSLTQQKIKSEQFDINANKTDNKSPGMKPKPVVVWRETLENISDAERKSISLKNNTFSMSEVETLKTSSHSSNSVIPGKIGSKTRNPSMFVHLSKIYTENELESTPIIFKIDWILATIASLNAPIVTIVYFKAIHPVLHPDGGIGLMDINIHVLNLVFALIDVVISARPIRLPHAYVAILFGLVYITFSVVFWAFDPVNNVIYEIMDWNSPGSAIALNVVLLVAIPIVQCLYFLLYRLKIKVLYQE